MNAHSQITDSSQIVLHKVREETTAPGDEVPACCGRSMQPHFAHAQDRYGNTFFVTVWRCAQCGRVFH